MSEANSRRISSGQSVVHRDLSKRLARHAASIFQKPLNDASRRAFDASIVVWQQRGCQPLILDAGCGVGLSCYHLARQFPMHFIIGVDQSVHRLSRGLDWPHPIPANLILVRADLVDYWRLLHDAEIRLARHYVLYPNPWPKVGQLARRWHGHAVFPTMVALGGYFECRSNWSIYVQECAAALSQLSAHSVAACPYTTDAPITPFERKYLASGHQLWHCETTLVPT